MFGLRLCVFEVTGGRFLLESMVEINRMTGRITPEQVVGLHRSTHKRKIGLEITAIGDVSIVYTANGRVKPTEKVFGVS